MVRSFKQLHTFFLAQSLYPVMLSTMLACALFTGRLLKTGSWMYVFLVWNLFLAWIPYLVSLGMIFIYRRQLRRGWLLLLPGLVWLIFFPNAPYIVTDFFHLYPRSGVPIWYDLALISAFAWSGLFLGIFSLRIMQTLVKGWVGLPVSWVFVGLILGLSGLGVYMGRFLRWNSWDLFFQPYAVLSDVASRLTNPLQHPGTFGMTVVFSLFLMVCYLTVAGQPGQEPQDYGA